MRVFDKAAVVEDACGILLRGLALASAGVCSPAAYYDMIGH